MRDRREEIVTVKLNIYDLPLPSVCKIVQVMKTQRYYGRAYTHSGFIHMLIIRSAVPLARSLSFVRSQTERVLEGIILIRAERDGPFSIRVIIHLI